MDPTLFKRFNFSKISLQFVDLDQMGCKLFAALGDDSKVMFLWGEGGRGD